MARAHRGRIVPRPAPRTMIWIGAGISHTVISSATTLISSLNAAALALRPFTIIRTHLTIDFHSDQAIASETVMAVYTKQVVTEQAAAAGVGSVPSGVAEPDADFYVYKPIMFDFLFSTASGFVETRGQWSVATVDSKAMRKVGNNDDIATVLDIRAFAGCHIAIEGRTLIKLH